jgi:hypothetical protein
VSALSGPIEFIDTIADDARLIAQLDREAARVRLDRFLRPLGDKLLVTADSDEGVLYRFYGSADAIVAGYVTVGTVALETFTGTDEYVTRRAAHDPDLDGLPPFVHEQHFFPATTTAELYDAHRAAIAHVTSCVQMHSIEDVCACFVASFDRLREWLGQTPAQLPKATARRRRDS